MAVTITLFTLPGRLTRARGYTLKTVEMFGESLDSDTLTAIASVADIRAAVARFGKKVRASHPEASFYVSVRLARGHRKPKGYDDATRSNGFGQDDFLHTEDGAVSADPHPLGEPAQALATKGVRA